MLRQAKRPLQCHACFSRTALLVPFDGLGHQGPKRWRGQLLSLGQHCTNVIQRLRGPLIRERDRRKRPERHPVEGAVDRQRLPDVQRISRKLLC